MSPVEIKAYKDLVPIEVRLRLYTRDSQHSSHSTHRSQLKGTKSLKDKKYVIVGRKHRRESPLLCLSKDSDSEGAYLNIHSENKQKQTNWISKRNKTSSL